MTLREATIKDLEMLVPLFDGYRMFYRQPSDLEGAKEFISKRMTASESIIYIAFLPENSPDQRAKPVGFTQLYPIFSSVSMERMYLLNDLYIHPDHRGQGIGTALINKVKERCRLEGQKGIALQTEVTNPAQKLYEHLGFQKDPDLQYFWPTN